jgi:hypothetical protein
MDRETAAIGKIMNDVVFCREVSEIELQDYLTSVHILRGKNSEEYRLVSMRYEIVKKRRLRREAKNYSTDIKFTKKCVITSGLSSYDFDCVKESRKKNFIDPSSTMEKGITRKNSDKIREIDCGKYSSRCKYTKWEYSPVVTSYVIYTPKYVMVRLENKVYRIRYAGKHFHFEQRDGCKFMLVHTKSGKHLELTALNIIYRLPKIRKNLHSIVKLLSN